MGRSKQFTDRQLERLIDKYAGCYQLIAGALKVSRQAVWERVQADEALKMKVWHAQEALTDLAHWSHIQRVRKGDEAAEDKQLFRTVSGRRRGFGRSDDTELIDRVTALEDLAKMLDLGAFDEASDGYGA